MIHPSHPSAKKEMKNEKKRKLQSNLRFVRVEVELQSLCVRGCVLPPLEE